MLPGPPRISAWLCRVLLLAPAVAQIRVMSPKTLVQSPSLSKTKGRIEGSTSTFGAPFFGDRVLGQLVYGESKGANHCTDEDYTVPDPEKTSNGHENHDHDQVRLINIVMVRRGLCSFVTKVHIAEEYKGAHAVIIVDRENSTLTSKDLEHVIVADDGYGDAVKIPSVLISKFDGDPLIEAAKAGYEVIVELAWEIPTNQYVQLDMWMSSASRESQKFLKEFSETRKTLNEVVAFTPHYHVFSADPTLGGYSGLCSDEKATYCTEDPDGAGLVTGKDVLDEDVRQLCIHEQYKVRSDTDGSRTIGAAGVYYAQEWWDYVKLMPEKCTLEAEEKANRFGKECSESVMTDLGIDVSKIQRCVLTDFEKKLDYERVNRAWSPRALRVNGWRYTGVMDPDLVTRAICSGFITRPQECDSLLTPRDPFVKYEGSKNKGGISATTLFMSILGIILLAFLAIMLYRRFLDKKIRLQIREEVMLEVNNQMGSYSKLGP